MKKVLLIPFMLLCMMLFTVPSFAMKNEPDNFRGIPWGAPLPKNNLFGKNKWGLTHLYGSLYKRSEEVSIGGAKITSRIEYNFYDGWGFARAYVEFSGQENYDLIRKMCIENWKEPDKENSYTFTDPETNKDSVVLDSYWIGERITVILSCDAERYKSGSLLFVLKNHNEIQAKEDVKRRQRVSGF